MRAVLFVFCIMFAFVVRMFWNDFVAPLPNRLPMNIGDAMELATFFLICVIYWRAKP